MHVFLTWTPVQLHLNISPLKRTPKLFKILFCCICFIIADKSLWISPKS